MKTLKRVLIIAAAILLLLVAVSYLLPGRITVQRSIEIAAKPEQVYAYVANLRRWPQWTIWYERNPSMAQRYEGPELGVGSVSEWRDASGHGRMTVTALEQNRLVAYDLLFDGEMLTRGSLRLEPRGEGATRVSWRFEGEAGLNPVSRYFALLFERWIADDFDAGLAKLKRLAESTS